jgi:hypothetical protein
MAEFSDLIANFMDSRYWYFTQPGNPQMKENFEYHKKALNDAFNSVSSKASSGSYWAEINTPLGGPR